MSGRRARLGAALLVAGLATAGCADRQVPPAPRQRANVLIYLVDTLRVDHLGCYGYPRPVSPAIDALAAQGVRFENAIAHSSWTRPTVASVLTGSTPLEHGVRSLQDRLAEDVETLPEILGAAGWSTAAFSPNWHVSKKTGFAQGFATFDFFPQDPSSESLTRRVLAWLDARPPEASSERPWFVYAHALDPHAPYDPPADLRQRFAGGVTRPGAGSHDDIVATMKLRRRDRGDRVRDLRALYDAEIADTDRQFGLLLEGLRARRQYDDTLIVLVADHGEGFDEHALLGHGNSLYGELVDIPLIVKPPGPARPRREAELARQIDVLPTVLAALGLPASASSGRDLLSPDPPSEAPFAVIDLLYERRRGIGLVTREWKYLEPLSRRFGRRYQLYSRLNDRLDAVDLADREPDRRGALARVLAREMRRPGRRAPQATIDAQDEAALRALGYL